MATKDPISCHVLDTLTGRPAADVKVSLILDPLANPELSPVVFSAVTNSDGRITNWTATEGRTVTVDMILEKAEEAEKTTVWKLKFFTGDYYGEGKTFWPEVDLIFYVKHGEHYHVPLLLGPYSYTTYRGS
jgi:5-hydroxyisourate hydrolase